MTTNVTNTIINIGANDHDVDLFEGQYIVPNGMAYNSYAIIDDKIAIMDTIDKKKTEEWLANIDAVLSGRKLDYLAVPPAMFTSRQGSYNSTGGRKPDYLIIQHMEPDHSANIDNFVKTYPDVTVVGNAKTFAMMEQFFGCKINLKLWVKVKEDWRNREAVLHSLGYDKTDFNL